MTPADSPASSTSERASLTLSGLTLRNGRADGAGGAIRARDGANVLLEYVAIEDCRALMVGGAVALVGSAPSQLTMRVVGISGCSAADGASAIESGGGAVLATVLSISHACDGAAPPVFGSGDGATWAMRGLKLVADGCSDAEAAQLVPEGVAALACSDRVFTHPFSGTELPICDASDAACVDVPAGDATVPACECEEGAFANPASPQLAPYGATGITTKGCLTPLYLSPPLTLVREEVTVRLLKSGSDFEAASVNVSLQVGGSAWEAAASYSWEVANADVLPEWVHLPAASGPIGCSESPCSVSVPLSILSEGLAERSEPYETNLTVRLKTEEVYEATIDITASIVAEPAVCVIDPRGVIDAVYDGAEDLPIALRQRIYDFATFTLSTRDAAGLPLHRNLASRFRLSATVDGEVMRVPEDGTVTLAFAGGGNYTVTLEANRMGYFVVEIEYTQPDGTAELVPAAARILVRAPPHSVPAGWWRASPNTTDLIECSIVPELGSEEWTPCQGGADAGVGGAGYCEVGYAGPRCEVCVNGTHYFDKAVGKCKLCEPLENSALKLLGVASAIFALLFALSPMLRSTYKPRHWALRRLVLVGRRILIRWSQYSMRAKAKNIFTLFQILAVVPSTYEVSLPKELTEWAAVLRWPEFLGLNLFIPGGCYGSYLNRLLVSAFWPIALIGLIILGCVVYVGGRRVRAREPLDREGWRAVLTTALLRALPPCLIVTFVCVPMASMRILRTFTCLHFTVDDITGEGATYLADDLSISCDSPEYKEVEAWAIGLLFLWPLGVPALYACLLWKCRNAIRTRRPNRLSRATIFLWGDYETRCFWWEPFEILRRLTLTGFVLISTTGYSMMRGLIATLISIAFLMGLSVLVPLRSKIDDALVLGCHLSLVILFVAVLVIKGCTDIPDYCAMYGMGDSPLGASLIFIVYAVCLLGLSMCIAFAFAVIALRHVTALRQNIRGQSSPPDPSLAKGRRFHLFLSHRWATGQDQMAVLKRQLQLVLPVERFLGRRRFAPHRRPRALHRRVAGDPYLPLAWLFQVAQLLARSRGGGGGEQAGGARPRGRLRKGRHDVRGGTPRVPATIPLLRLRRPRVDHVAPHLRLPAPLRQADRHAPACRLPKLPQAQVRALLPRRAHLREPHPPLARRNLPLATQRRRGRICRGARHRLPRRVAGAVAEPTVAPPGPRPQRPRSAREHELRRRQRRRGRSNRILEGLHPAEPCAGTSLQAERARGEVLSAAAQPEHLPRRARRGAGA